MKNHGIKGMSRKNRESPLVASWSARVTKRMFDLVVSLALLILLMPMLLLVALGVRIMHGSPVLFSQQRPGRNNQLFAIYKFRTMTNERDASGALLPDGKRLTGLGRFLRGTSIDELPELLNVLRGDMSLVGPRPLLVEYLPYYSKRENVRHSVRPGLTGWAQINGRNYRPWNERLSLDVWYVEHWSFWLDLKILVLTAFKVIRREGVSVDASAVESRLDHERAVIRDLS